MRILLVPLLLALAASTLPAQPREGKSVELSLSGCYQHLSSGIGQNGSGVFLVSPRFGYFIIEGLEIEPEIVALFTSNSDPAYILNGNLSYNFQTGKRGGPFLLVGYGLANAIPLLNVPTLITNSPVGVFNVGVGLKIFATDDVAIRLEYRFQAFSGENDMRFDPQTIDAEIQTVQFGLSVLL